MLSQSECSLPQHKGMPRTYVALPTGPHLDFALRFREACTHGEITGSLKVLAKVFDVSAPTVHDWRHGNKLPSSDMLLDILPVLKDGDS